MTCTGNVSGSGSTSHAMAGDPGNSVDGLPLQILRQPALGGLAGDRAFRPVHVAVGIHGDAFSTAAIGFPGLVGWNEGRDLVFLGVSDPDTCLPAGAAGRGGAPG